MNVGFDVALNMDEGSAQARKAGTQCTAQQGAGSSMAGCSSGARSTALTWHHVVSLRDDPITQEAPASYEAIGTQRPKEPKRQWQERRLHHRPRGLRQNQRGRRPAPVR